MDAGVNTACWAPYVFRVAISDHRIVNVDEDNKQVTFWYRHKESRHRRTLTLDIMEFMRRFLHHVLPAGFMKVRYGGFTPPRPRITPVTENRPPTTLAA